MSDLRITSSSLLAQATNNGSKNKITENDTVIDNAPASPNAPKASDDAVPAVGNQKVGQ